MTQALEAYLEGSGFGVQGSETKYSPNPELRTPIPTIYTCGPEPMMKRVADIAISRGIPCQIAVERAMACGMGTCQSCCIKVRKPDPRQPPLVGKDWCYRLACTDGPVFRGRPALVNPMRLITLLFLVLLAPLAHGATITLARADELLGEKTIDPWEDRKDGSAIAWNEAYTLDALIDLYDATGDVKYLTELVQRSDRVIAHRDDKRNFADYTGKAHKRWSIDSKYTVAVAQLVADDGEPASARLNDFGQQPRHVRVHHSPRGPFYAQGNEQSMETGRGVCRPERRSQ